VDRPELPPPVPGRPALPVFVGFEDALEGLLESARREARERVERAEREAERVRREGEERLRQVLLDAQEEARRTAEDRARDSVSRARVAVQRWIERAEGASGEAVEAALELLGRE
jgi:vacuolar-type H+-ATPase subunit H